MISEEFLLIRYLYAIASGSIIAIVFEMVFSYALYRFLSSSGRTENETNGPKVFRMFKEMGWQIVYDGLVVMTLGFLSYIVGSHSIWIIVMIGVIIGLLDIRMLRMLYSNLISRRILVRLLYGIALTQKVVISIIVWTVYWGPEIL
jgi:hypothetical protein